MLRSPRILLAALPLLALPTVLAAADDGQSVGARIESTRDLLERWVETRRVISEEQRDWTLGRELLESRIDILRRDIGVVKGKVDDAQKSIGEADLKRAELVAEADRLKATSAELAAIASSLEARTRAIVRRLPDPIREKVRPLSQRLPEEGADTGLSLSVRFQNAVGILNEINKFSREITVASEVRKLSDGTSAEVTAVYIGLAQGYYVGANGKLAGYGFAGSDGWTWTAANDAAPAITKVVAILKNEAPAEFVPLPLTIN
ncbi:MAG: hypothetical protein RLZZ238_1845 [Planctomycetota bacterium]|jgi:hypothetical protein